MPKGIYIRTEQHLEKLRSIAKILIENGKHVSQNQFAENNPTWKGGKKSWIEREAKHVVLENRKELDFCEYKNHKFKGKYNIHHKDKNRHNNHISNLLVACIPCHSKIEAKQRRRDGFGRFCKAC